MTISFTAIGSGYFRVWKDGVQVSQHVAEREALESLSNVKTEFPDSDAYVDHDYRVEADMGIGENVGENTGSDTGSEGSTIRLQWLPFSLPTVQDGQAWSINLSDYILGTSNPIFTIASGQLPSGIGLNSNGTFSGTANGIDSGTATFTLNGSVNSESVAWSVIAVGTQLWTAIGDDVPLGERPSVDFTNSWSGRTQVSSSNEQSYTGSRSFKALYFADDRNFQSAMNLFTNTATPTPVLSDGSEMWYKFSYFLPNDWDFDCFIGGGGCGMKWTRLGQTLSGTPDAGVGGSVGWIFQMGIKSDGDGFGLGQNITYPPDGLSHFNRGHSGDNPANQPFPHARDWDIPGGITKGVWHTMEVYVKLSNSPSVTEGDLTVWHDELPVFISLPGSVTGWGDWWTLHSSASGVEEIQDRENWNGGAPKDQHCYFDGYRMQTFTPNNRDVNGFPFMGSTWGSE